MCKILKYHGYTNQAFTVNSFRAVRPVFKHIPGYINFLNIEILYFHTINIGM